MNQRLAPMTDQRQKGDVVRIVITFGLLSLLLCLLLVPAVSAQEPKELFIALGDQILRAPKAFIDGSELADDPELAVGEADPVFEEPGLAFHGLVYAGDGLLYVCAESDAGGTIFRFDPSLELPMTTGDDPVVRPWNFDDSAIETIDSTLASPRCGTVDVDGSLVVASGAGGLYRFENVAGMGLFDDDLDNACPLLEGADPLAVDFCYPYGEGVGFPDPKPLAPNTSVLGDVVDVAYFYNSDFLSLAAASSGDGPGNSGKGGSPGQLLRSIYPYYETYGFDTDGCPPPPSVSNPESKNTKALLDDLDEPTAVALSGGEIFVTDGKNLVRVDFPEGPPALYPACAEEPVAEVASCASFGNLAATSLAGDVGGSLFVGTGSNSKDAVIYRVDDCGEPDDLLVFPKQDWPTTISGLALVPGSITDYPAAYGGNPIPLDGSHEYTLEATCDAEDTIEAGPKALARVLAHINDIQPGGDANTPDYNNIIGSPSAFPGYDGFPWMWEVYDCDPIPGEIYERHIISSYQRGTNLRIGASDSACVPPSHPDPSQCNSEYIRLEFNVPWDPDLVPVDPIGGRRGGTQTFLSAAAIDNAVRAEFCGYQSPLSPGLDPENEPIPVVSFGTTPVKFKLQELGEDPDIVCDAGVPLNNAEVMISVARIRAEPETDTCPDFEVIFPLVPNGAGTADPTPLYDTPGQQGNNNYNFNLDVNQDDYCDGLYLITSTFLTDNAVEQQTLFRVDAVP